MPSRPCITCGVLVPTDRSYCVLHQPVRESRQTVGRKVSHKVRKEVLSRAGHRCEAINHHGARCTATMGLEVHHKVPLVDGGSNLPASLVCVCGHHHRLHERYLDQQRQARVMQGLVRDAYRRK